MVHGISRILQVLIATFACMLLPGFLGCGFVDQIAANAPANVGTSRYHQLAQEIEEEFCQMMDSWE